MLAPESIARNPMLEQIYHSLEARCRAALETGNSETDFQSRLIAGLAVVIGTIVMALTAAELSDGAYLNAAVVTMIPLGMGWALWMLFVRRNLNAASAVLISSFLSVLTIVLLFSGGTLAGGFVALPVLVMLAAILCSRRVAICVALFSIVIAGIATWLSTTDWNFPLLPNSHPSWLLARVAVISSVLTLISIFLFRTSAEHVRDKAALVQAELESANAELSKVLSSQLTTERLMFKVQEIGDLIGWWYEPETGRVHYTSLAEKEFKSFRLKISAENEKKQDPVAKKFRNHVSEKLAGDGPWDREVRLDRGDGSSVWYRDTGEIEKVNGEMQRVVGVLQDITEAKTLSDQLELHANYDELTGLANRRIFWKAVSQEYETFDEAKPVAHLLFIDLDQFKLVNDTSGHVAGDRLLQIVSSVLEKNVQANDFVGRVGGDEFAVILRECPPSDVSKVANRLRESIEQVHFHWSGETFRVGASIGVISIEPRHGSAEELQQLVDAACYEAKLAGRNRVNLFEEGEDVIAAQRGEARWVQRLHDAMTHNRFELHGQLIKPIRDTGEPDRYEVLIRLREADSDRLIPPGAFLPAAERFGLSPQVDQWVIEHLLRRLHADPNIKSLHRKYWVNLSGNSIGDSVFANYLVETIRNSTLPKGMINFEITETAVIRNIDAAEELIASLRAMGCQFALDDFGSGLSSFGYLKKLSVDYLKIDGMFVKEILNDEADRVFVQAIISIAKAMGMKTVAEFVENDEIYSLVESFGVDYAQGYGVHKPEKLNFYESNVVRMNPGKKAG